ncbi:hypothetical protein [Streptomyces sp. A30]|uniref:hypothetical protein n=1 Tax=Streptomyces sp. A30 TaxID=2789273 RepID=UPI0039803307
MTTNDVIDELIDTAGKLPQYGQTAMDWALENAWWVLGPVWSSDQEFGRSPAREGSVLIGRQSWREAISPMSSGP